MELLTTDDLAVSIGIKPQSIRARLSRTGSYFSLRPRRMPNGRLLWPSDAVDRLTSYRSGSRKRHAER